jgi:Lysyl oxidase
MRQQGRSPLFATSSIGMIVHKNTRRRRARRPLAALLSFLVLTGLLAVAFVVPATGAGTGELLPDLQADSVGEADSTATYTDNTGSHLLLRFSSYIRNVGPGPLEVTGVNPVNRSISGDDLRQVITHDDATKVDEAMPGAQLKYEETDGHNHWHFQNAARYSLWNSDKTEEVGFSSKVGFCFLDIGHGDPNYDPAVDSPDHFLYSGTVAPYPTPFGSSTNNCLAYDPDFPDLTDEVQPPRTKIDMGISTGWRDVYEKTLPFQYVDVSDVTPGHYWIRSQVDPLNLIRESNEENDPAFSTSPSTVPGYIAKPVNAGQISGVKPSTSTITLSSTKYANDADPAIGAVRYKVVEQPEHGTLAPASGTADVDGWFAASQLVYTKDVAYNGPDTFKYVAKQSGSPFPLSPASASVTMQVGSGNGATTVGINGAPSQLYTAAGIQLTASVVPEGDVTWRVDDVAGGNATVGTIDASGFYRAPATVPANGKVRITATSDDGAFDAVEVTIVARPVVKPKPDVPDPPKPPVVNPPKPPITTPAVTALSKPTIGRVGRRLLVKYMPGKSGKLSVSISRKGKRLASCKVTVQKGRALTCRFTLKKSKVKKLTGSLTVYAKLTSKGKTLGTRRTTVSLKVTASSTRIGPLCILTPIKG